MKNLSKQFLLLFFPLCSWAQDGVPSLQELVGKALDKDYTLANEILDIQATRIDESRLKESFLPRIDLTAKDAFLLSSFSVKSIQPTNPYCVDGLSDR